MSIGTAYACIWDTGGTDRITYSGRSDVVINLNAATLDGDIDLGLGELRGLRAVAQLTHAERAGMFDDVRTAGGSFSFVRGQAGGYSIANGVDIEIAIGGKGDDILIGNGRANMLTVGGGRDVLFGTGGDDVLTGGRGADIFVYSTARRSPTSMPPKVTGWSATGT
jgi:Ca2+-binding RTX toxin-like protein